ncbi:hypothetical protein OC861_007066, partial [Tilletia horrida]
LVTASDVAARNAELFGLFSSLLRPPSEATAWSAAEHLAADQEVLEDLAHVAGSDDPASYAPYPDKITFMIHAIANRPRKPMSVLQIRSILLALRVIGVPNVPKYSKYKRLIKAIRSTIHACQTKEVKGIEGNKFIIKALESSIAADFANPSIRSNLHLYPRRLEKIAGYMDGERAWSDVINQAPMAVMPSGKHAYIKEVVETRDGLIWVVRWFEGEAGLSGEGLSATLGADKIAVGTVRKEFSVET